NVHDLSCQVLEKFMSRLVQNRVMAHKDLRTLSKYQLILARDQFRKNPPPHLKAWTFLEILNKTYSFLLCGPQQGMLEGDFALCISLYHGYELLMQMGLRSLFFYFQGIMDGSRDMSRAKNELQRTPMFMALYHDMKTKFAKPATGPDEPFIYSHPKLERLEEVVLQHFRVWAESSADNNGPQGENTRVMIFSSFRESVQEIAAMLNRHSPLIRVMTFMGQASAGKGVKGFTQKEQLEVVQRFRQGGFNTLVSTCVGEEGLDIGEVDLIVCFDAQKNPIRLVQRMGRTGRKRQGRIVVILAEGKEERTYNQSQSNKRSVYKSITGNNSSFLMYPNSPRMLPDGVNPTLHKMHITCGQFDHGEGSRRSVRGRRSHSEGRASLIHPQNLIQQGCTKSDGFLSSAEYSVWASTMKLEEHETHPTFKNSHFVSIPHQEEHRVQEKNPKNRPQSRELSLWEWRHWQHKALPFHAVDHSLRCNHFIKVMELIDGMKEENEGECRYEEELLPYIHKEYTEKIRLTKQKATKTHAKSTNSKPKPSTSSWTELENMEVGLEEENPWTAGLDLAWTKQKPVPEDNAEVPCDTMADNSRRVDSSDNEDCAIVNVSNADYACADPPNPDDISEANANSDEDLEVEAMFYLPKWERTPQPLLDKAGKSENLKAILSNVAELLSRSPPPLADILEVEPAAHLPAAFSPPHHQPFVVSFNLSIEDDDEDTSGGAGSPAPGPEAAQPSTKTEVGTSEQPVGTAASSPSWDEVFEDNDDDIRDDNVETNYARYNYSNYEGNGEIKSNEGLASKEKDVSCKRRDESFPQLINDGNEEVRGSQDSIDLFEDDEAFLQMTIPDIATPEDNVPSNTFPDAKDTDKYSEELALPANNPTPTNPSSTAQPVHCTRGLNAVCMKEVQTEHRTHAPNPRREDQESHNITETKLNLHTVVQNELITDHSKKVAPHFNVFDVSEQFDTSTDLFPVNFDLGYSLEDSDDETEAGAVPEPGAPADPYPSTPYNRLNTESKLSTPGIPSESGIRKCRVLLSPITSTGVRRTLLPGHARPASSSWKRRRPESGSSLRESVHVVDSPPHPECSSNSEDEVVFHKRRHQNKVNPLSSPEMAKMASDVDSPVVTKRKRTNALNTSDESQEEAVSDEDFQNESMITRRTTAPYAKRKRAKQAKHKNTTCPKGRHFLDEEAQVSDDENGAGLSSDEEDGEDQNRSLDGFVVDNTHLSQGLNDSEMQGIYLKSVRSPAVQGKFKMSYRNHHNMDIFSQVPEMDETYAEDSFVVGSDVEELESNEEEEAEDVELIPEASFVDGRRQYATRRRVFLHKARAGDGTKAGVRPPPEQRAGGKKKRTRIIHMNGSSEEETEDASTEGSGIPLRPNSAQPDPSKQRALFPASVSIASKVSLLSKAERSSVSAEQQAERCRQRLENQHLLSEELDFAEAEQPFPSKKPSQPVSGTSSGPHQSASRDRTAGGSRPAPGSVCILADSRCISNGVELMSCLRQRHAATVHVCSLDGSYFIVSNRMAVERHSQSELAALQNRKRLADRVNSLQELFERVCLIVEKDRTKPGEATRPFQRTRLYDSTLAALVRLGVRLLWSDGAEESAGLLADLAGLEQRKGQGIAVPLEVKGQHSQQALQLYLSLPSVSYVHALNLSHNFSSISQMIDSPIEAIQKAGCMSRPRAEEIYRFLRYSCDSFLMDTSKTGKTS
ncbi:unnamed protein product, partial [Menidia menidia]